MRPALIIKMINYPALIFGLAGLAVGKPIFTNNFFYFHINYPTNRCTIKYSDMS